MAEVIMRVIGSFLIILVGFLLSRIGSALLMRMYRNRKTGLLDEPASAKIYTYAIMTTSIVLALIALRFDIYTIFVYTIYSNLPIVISAVLLIILTILVVQFVFFSLHQFLKRSGLMTVVQDYGREGLLTVSLAVLKGIVYIILILVSLNLLGIDISKIVKTLGWVLLPLLIMILGLLFVGLKNFVENVAYGFYIKSTHLVRVGEIIKIRNMEGTIRSISYQGTLLHTKNGYSIFILHRQLFKNFVYFKKVEPILDTLEKIKDHYISQQRSFCGPASASVVLKIFGIDVPQEKIGKMAKTEVGKGTHPRTLIQVVQKITERKVIGIWVDIDKIYNLRREIKTWLYDGGFPILDFKKSALFPDSTTAHYSVCLGVQGDDLLILDPNEKKGGIYYSDYRTVHKGMDTHSELIGGKRGFLVLAPKGTTAHYRIENGLAYSDVDLYGKLNNSLRAKLKKMAAKSSVIESVLPQNVQKMIKDYRKTDKVSRLWQPKT